MKFIESNKIQIDPCKRPKKLTATRFASVLGLNPWATPFQIWCEVCRVWEKPFEESKQTLAGKIIEPKIAEYLKERYFMDIKSPTDIYGADYFKQTFGDFFHEQKILGGMWDFVGDNFIVEVKTTQRAEDWKAPDGTITVPEYYSLQAALYAYLKGFDHVVMTCSFLSPSDYPTGNPTDGFDTSATDKWMPNIDNTIVVEFDVSEKYPHFEDNYVVPALNWWHDYVETGISPAFDEKKDAEVLKELRKHTISGDNDLELKLKEADKLKTTIDKAESKIEEKKARLKELESLIKSSLMDKFEDGDKQVEITSKHYTWTLTKSSRSSFDSASFKKAEPETYKQYMKTSDVYTMKTKSEEEN